MKPQSLSYIQLLLFLSAVFCNMAVHAQDSVASPCIYTTSEHGSALSKRIDCRLTLEGGGGSWFGMGYAYTGVAPEIRYHFNNRFTVSTGMRVLNGFGLSRSIGIQSSHQSLAPKRGGTKLIEAYVANEYQVNERLWIAASLLHIGGEIDFTPFHSKNATHVSATAFSANLCYRTHRGSLLDFHISYIDDHNGLLAPYFYDFNMDGLHWYGDSMGFSLGRSFGFY